MRRLLLSSMLLAAAACRDGAPFVDAGPRIDGPIVPRCGLEPFYASLDLLECGLGPPDAGPEPCRWTLRFGGDAFNAVVWSHSDVEETGSYSCVAGHILATFPSGEIEATFSTGSDRITWDGVVYVEPGLADAGR